MSRPPNSFFPLVILTVVNLHVFIAVLAVLSSPMKPEPTQTFSQLLRADNRFTDRDFMKALGMGHPKLKSREADPSLFTIGELMLLANLIGRSVKDVMQVVLAQAEHNPQVAEKSKEAQELVVGRKYYPRKAKETTL